MSQHEAAWYKSQIALVSAALTLLIVLGAAFLIPLSQYCKPERTEQAPISNDSAAQYEQPSSTKSALREVGEAVYRDQQAQYEANTGTKKRDNWWHGFLCEMKITDFLIATFTLWLVIIGAWQGYQLQQTVQATKDAAEALPRIERAYVFLDSAQLTSLGATVTTHDSSKWNQKFAFNLRNHGNTPAIVQELFAEVKLCRNFSEATGARGTFFPPGLIINSADIPGFSDEFSCDNADYQRAKMTGTPMLLFFGLVSYEDVLGKRRVTGFCWKYDFAEKEFRLALDPEHNYWT